MSRIFFDHLIEIEEIKIYINGIAESHEEREDLWALIDEFINHKIVASILSELDETFHDEFLSMFLDKPYDNGIVNYLNEKLPLPLENLINDKMVLIVSELCETLEAPRPAQKNLKTVKKKTRKNK